MRVRLAIGILFFAGSLLASDMNSSIESTEVRQALEFSAALEQILGRSTTIDDQKAQLKSVEARNLAAELRYLPSLELEARQTTQKTFGITSNRQSLGLGVQMNLFKFGADSAAMSAAERQIEAETSALNQSILLAEKEAVQTLVEVIAANRELVITEQILETRKDSLGIAKKRFKRGLLPIEEVEKISVDVSNADAQLNDTKVRLVSANAELNRLLGGGYIVPQWPWKDKFKERIEPLLAQRGWEPNARPDVQEAKSRLLAAEEQVDESWGKIFPSLDLGFSYNLFQSKVAGLNNNGNEWTGTIALTIPLFDRLTNYSNYRAQIHQKTRAEVALERTRRFADSDWESAKRSLKISYETALAREKTVLVSRRLYQANLRRFNKGVIGANELIIDQDRLFRSERFAISGWADVHNNFTRFCHAQGKRVGGCINGTNL